MLDESEATGGGHKPRSSRSRSLVTQLRSIRPTCGGAHPSPTAPRQATNSSDSSSLHCPSLPLTPHELQACGGNSQLSTHDNSMQPLLPQKKEETIRKPSLHQPTSAKCSPQSSKRINTSSKPPPHITTPGTSQEPSQWGTPSRELPSPTPNSGSVITRPGTLQAVQNLASNELPPALPGDQCASDQISLLQPTVGSATCLHTAQSNPYAAAEAVQEVTLSGRVLTSRGTLTPHGGHPNHYTPPLPGTYMYEPPSMTETLMSVPVTTGSLWGGEDSPASTSTGRLRAAMAWWGPPGPGSRHANISPQASGPWMTRTECASVAQ